MKRVKVTHPPRTLRCTSVVFSPVQYKHGPLDEAARCSGGCDSEENSEGKIEKKEGVR